MMKTRKKGQLTNKLLLALKISLPLSIILYLARGFGFLSFLPSGLILLTIVVFLFSFFGYLVAKTFV